MIVMMTTPLDRYHRCADDGHYGCSRRRFETILFGPSTEVEDGVSRRFYFGPSTEVEDGVSRRFCFGPSTEVREDVRPNFHGVREATLQQSMVALSSLVYSDFILVPSKSGSDLSISVVREVEAAKPVVVGTDEVAG
ncbi:hypothetical protein vseg_015818 [Gypsophila vaccaria]